MISAIAYSDKYIIFDTPASNITIGYHLNSNRMQNVSFFEFKWLFQSIKVYIASYIEIGNVTSDITVFYYLKVTQD